MSKKDDGICMCGICEECEATNLSEERHTELLNQRSYSLENILRSKQRIVGKPWMRSPLLYGDRLSTGFDKLNMRIGGGFRRGQLAMISAGAFPPGYDHFKSNYLADVLFGGRHPLVASLEDMKFENAIGKDPEIKDNFFDKLRDMMTSGLPIRAVRVPAGTPKEKIVRYTGYTDRSTVYEDVITSIRSNPNAIGPATVIELKGLEVLVGGKRVHYLPTKWGYGVDSITNIERIYHMPGTYGAYGKLTISYPVFGGESVSFKPFDREPWAEDAIDKLVYLQLYGRAYGKDSNGNFLVPGRITNFGLQTAQYHKMQARERLRAASNPERQKRGY